MAVIRSLQTITLIVKRSPLDDADIDVVRRFAADLQYDLVYHPGIVAADLNRFSVHPTPLYHDAVRALLDAGDESGLSCRLQPRHLSRQRRPAFLLPPVQVVPDTGDT